MASSAGTTREAQWVINPHMRRTLAANLGLGGGNGSSNNNNHDNCNDCNDHDGATTNKDNDDGNGNVSNTNDTRDKEGDTDIVMLEVRDSNSEKFNTESEEGNMGGCSQNKKTQREKISQPKHQ